MGSETLVISAAHLFFAARPEEGALRCTRRSARILVDGATPLHGDAARHGGPRCRAGLVPEIPPLCFFDTRWCRRGPENAAAWVERRGPMVRGSCLWSVGLLQHVVQLLSSPRSARTTSRAI